MHFRNTTPADQEQIRQLLREVFRANDNAPFLDPSNLAWKYYAERSDWPGSRSFVLAEDGRILAHLCAWPFRVMWNGQIITGFHPVDWAARPEARGSGTQLIRQLRKLEDVLDIERACDALEAFTAAGRYLQRDGTWAVAR